MDSHGSSVTWPSWVAQQAWLSALSRGAEEEARERGDTTVAGHHLALALTCEERTIALLDRLGLSSRRWRDYLNFVLGVNAGRRSEREQRMRPGQHRTFAEIYHHGALWVDVTARLPIEAARGEADRSGHPVGAAHVLLALAAGGGGIGTGTLGWLGLSPASVRRVAGLPAPPPEPVPPASADAPRPQGRGPLVLFGGDALAHEAAAVLVDLATPAGTDRAIRIAVVGAAADDPGVTAGRVEELQAMLPRADVIDTRLANRDAAHDPRVCDELARADVVFLDGGRVLRLHQTLAQSPALAALGAASDRGAVIAGYSAGSQVLGAGARHGPPVDPSSIYLLGWLPNTVIVPHCSGPAMLEELRATMRAFPATRGLGIAHASAVLLPPGWQHIENIATGFDHGSVVIDHPDSPPHLFQRRPRHPE